MKAGSTMGRCTRYHERFPIGLPFRWAVVIVALATILCVVLPTDFANAFNGERKGFILGGGAVGVETALLLAEKGTLSGDALKFLFVNKAETPEALYELATRGTK